MLTDATSKHVLGTTELTCLMPIKSGFVGEFETRTYATRLRIAMSVLNTLRITAREVAVLKVVPDIVDVIRLIHSFQLTIIGNKQLLLAVTFDGPWESYMRFVWKGLGPLLDLLLINCVDYESHASDKGFDRFSAWVRRHQIETGLFYAASACSVDDIRYLTQLESAQLHEVCPETFARTAATLVALDPARQVEQAIEQAIEQGARKEPKEDVPRMIAELGLKVISALYALRDSYPDPDARYLRRAAKETLKAFDTTTIPAELQEESEAELAWFNGPVAPPERRPQREPDYSQMQGGILPKERKQTDTGKTRSAHGCLLLARVVEPSTARKFLIEKLIDFVAHGGESRDGVYTNVAFTFAGLKRLGVTDTKLAQFPKEFREGMEARAGLLGDVQSNHPKNWSRPEWNWPDPANSTKEPVRLSTIDIVVKMRISGPSGRNEHAWSAHHPLYTSATTLFTDPRETGVQVMSVQPMLHHVKGERIVDHFGFVDGISQPVVQPDRDPENRRWDNDVALGELFLGHHNDRGDSAFQKDDPDALPGREVGSLLDNGTFLVVRKLEQNVDALEQCIKAFLETEKGRKNPLCAEQVRAKMMGRKLNGDRLTTEDPPPDRNDFTFEDDPNGSQCPLHAHIRRGNPREGRIPRIMRRGMTYGPLYEDNPNEERGIMFLAYNASIAEQFEVIQRWMAGGNSTGGFSGHADPFLRVPQNGENAIFRFIHDKDKEVRRIDLGCKPFVSLKWGMYLFVPSISALEEIASEPKVDSEAPKAQIAFGEKTIASLQTDAEWSAILEDVTASHSGLNAAVYAAIRSRGGVLRTPERGMVLVASEPLVKEVLENDDVFSVSEYKDRMSKSIGEIYLGLDSGEEYLRLSKVNDLVSSIGREEAFRIAEDEAGNVLAEMLAKGRPVTIALAAYADRVLARLSTHWFGVPNAKPDDPDASEPKIIEGGRPAPGADTVHLPHHSLAPSRYIFSSPCPRDVVIGAGQRHGQLLRNKVTELAKAKGVEGFRTELARDLWNATTNESGGPNPELFARMLIGLIEGFLPTVYGNFLKTMHLWVADETLWRVQQDLLTWRPHPQGAAASYARAEAIMERELKRAMQKRPVPDVVYRTATQRHSLAGVTVDAGERVVVLIASATHELSDQHNPEPDVMPVFGGDRKQKSHPTHACPAYDMGMGVLLGMISAILEVGTLMPTESPQSITVIPAAAPLTA